jgi:hypothetical protein
MLQSTKLLNGKVSVGISLNDGRVLFVAALSEQAESPAPANHKPINNRVTLIAKMFILAKIGFLYYSRVEGMRNRFLKYG